jgi:transcriptional regulator with XRE-family HTH domain
MSTIALLLKARDAAESGLARQLRMDAGLSLGDIARAVDRTPSCVSRWENGLRVPQGEAAARYAEVLTDLETYAVRSQNDVEPEGNGLDGNLRPQEAPHADYTGD